MITFTLNLAVPPLTDQTVWFANAQSWSNYWTGVGGEATIDPIVTSIYAPNIFVDGDPCITDIDGIQWQLISKPVFDSLVAQVAALDTALQTMRTELRDAGLITQSQ